MVALGRGWMWIDEPEARPVAPRVCHPVVIARYALRSMFRTPWLLLLVAPLVGQAPGTEATRVWSVSKSDGSQTFYVKYGDWFAWLCLVVTVGLSIFSFKKKVLPRREIES